MLLSLVAACGRAEPGVRQAALTVFAAASLRDAFGAIATDFERTQPGVKVTFSFAGTQELRTQVEHGARADVFASADQKHMSELMRAGRATSPVIFARNEPVVVVAKGSDALVSSFAELPSAARIVIGTPEVPIGRYTLELLDRASGKLGPDFRARVEQQVVSRELNVRQVLAKVSLGEAQAGIVYRTDASSAGASVAVVAIPEAINVIAEYPIAVLRDAPEPALAQAFVRFVLSPDGQRALGAAGFLAPPNGGAAR